MCRAGLEVGLQDSAAHIMSVVTEAVGPPIMDVEDRIVPWIQCSVERLEMQREMVRALGYCPLCENLDYRVIFAESGRGWPHPTFAELRESGQNGCSSCSFLFTALSDCRANTGLPIRVEDRPYDAEHIWMPVEETLTTWAIRYTEQISPQEPTDPPTEEALQNTGAFLVVLDQHHPPGTSMGSIFTRLRFRIIGWGNWLYSGAIEINRVPGKCPFRISPKKKDADLSHRPGLSVDSLPFMRRVPLPIRRYEMHPAHQADA